MRGYFFVEAEWAFTSSIILKVKSLSRVRLFATPWTVGHQAPPSMGFSRQEYWSGFPFPSPGYLPDPGIEHRPAQWLNPGLLHAGRFFTIWAIRDKNLPFLAILYSFLVFSAAFLAKQYRIINNNDSSNSKNKHLFNWHLLIAYLALGSRNERESEVAQSCPTLSYPVDCRPPGSSLRGISQARILEWVAISFSRGSSRPRDRTLVSHIAGRCFTLWATRKAL